MKVSIRQGQTIELLARVTNDDGSYPALNSITGITRAIFNTTTGQSVSTGPLVVADVMTATPTLDDRWREDDTGYNLAVQILPAALPTAANYRVTLTIAHANGTTTPLAWMVQNLPT